MKKGPEEHSYHLISPDGVEISGLGIRQFCRDNNQRQQDISEVLRGDLFQANGWRRYSPELIGVVYNKKEVWSKAAKEGWKKREREKLPVSDEELVRLVKEEKKSRAVLGVMFGKSKTYMHEYCKARGV